MSLHLICEFVRFLLQKIRNFSKLEKLEEVMKKQYFEKKRFHLKRYLCQNRDAENMPVVAGRLVT